jgi:membrane protease YdiL (CAAX protease family)
MNRVEQSFSLTGLFTGENRRPTIILLLAPVLVVTSKYFGSKSFYLENLSSSFALHGNTQWTAAVYVFLATFVLFGLIPMAVVRFVFNDRLSDYGLQVGDWRFGIKAIAVIAPIMMLSAYPSSKMPDFLAEYPLYKGVGDSAAAFLHHAILYLLFYIGWEVFFRGFMQFGLRGKFGDWYSILIQTMASCLWHIGKPAGETYTSIIGAIVWGIVVFRSRSLLYVILIHWLLGVSLDFFICFAS